MFIRTSLDLDFLTSRVGLQFFTEDFFDFLRGFPEDFPNPSDFFAVYPAGPPPDEPPQISDLVHDITKLVTEFGTPWSPAPS